VKGVKKVKDKMALLAFFLRKMAKIIKPSAPTGTPPYLANRVAVSSQHGLHHAFVINKPSGAKNQAIWSQ
jgi:hypothetical protein